jgi:hypothetical protein
MRRSQVQQLVEEVLFDEDLEGRDAMHPPPSAGSVSARRGSMPASQQRGSAAVHQERRRRTRSTTRHFVELDERGDRCPDSL